MRIVRVNKTYEVVNEIGQVLKKFVSFDSARTFVLGEENADFEKGSVDLFGTYDVAPASRRYRRNRAKYRKIETTDK